MTTKRGKQKTHPGQKLPRQANQHGNVFQMPTKIKTKARKYANPPSAPRYITGAAAKFWKQYARAYWEAERLNKDTVSLFCQLCTAWGRWQDFTEMQSELFEKNPKGRGLIFKDGASIVTKPNGKVEEKAGSVKVSIPADRSEKAEAHFYKQFEKFLDITERFSKPEVVKDTWGD